MLRLSALSILTQGRSKDPKNAHVAVEMGHMPFFGNAMNAMERGRFITMSPLRKTVPIAEQYTNLIFRQNRFCNDARRTNE